MGEHKKPSRVRRRGGTHTRKCLVHLAKIQIIVVEFLACIYIYGIAGGCNMVILSVVVFEPYSEMDVMKIKNFAKSPLTRYSPSVLSAVEL